MRVFVYVYLPFPDIENGMVGMPRVVVNPLKVFHLPEHLEVVFANL